MKARRSTGIEQRHERHIKPANALSPPPTPDLSNWADHLRERRQHRRREVVRRVAEEAHQPDPAESPRFGQPHRPTLEPTRPPRTPDRKSTRLNSSHVEI